MSIVFIDLETTGLGIGLHDIWECGAVKVHDDDGRVEERHWFVVPTNLPAADREALDIGGFSARYDADTAVLAQTFTEEFTEWVEGDTLAANNCSFDVSFLKIYSSYYGYGESWHYSSIDVKSYAAGALGIGFPMPKTSTLAQMLGVPENEDAHTALADAHFAKAVYEAAHQHANR